MIPEGTTRVEMQAAYGNEHLQKVTFPETLRSIGDFAFFGCKNLETVVFKSYYAPTLEGMPSVAKDEDVTINVDNIGNYPGFETLYNQLRQHLKSPTGYYANRHAGYR